MTSRQLPSLGYICRQRRLEEYFTSTGNEVERWRVGRCPTTDIHIDLPFLSIDKYAEKLFTKAQEVYDILANEESRPYIYEFGLCDLQSRTIAGPNSKDERSISQAQQRVLDAGKIINYISLVGHERQGDIFLVNLGEDTTLRALQAARERRRLK